MQDNPPVRPVPELISIPRTADQIAQYILDPKPTGSMPVLPPPALAGVRPGLRPLQIPRIRPTLQVGPFQAAIQTILQGQCEGAILELRQNGEPLFTVSTGFAQAPGDGNIAWSSQAPMHIASMSKQQAQAMLDNKFGIDWIASSAAGSFHIKNGAWNLRNGQSEQGLLFFFP